MRFSSSILALIASWLLLAPSAHAATRAGTERLERGAERRTSFGHTAALGPLAVESIAERAGLRDTGAFLRCGSDETDGDDDAMIQDDAPAARIDAGDGVAPVLEPLGTLASLQDALPSHRILTRRSPRGPPIF
jgi:hypothetical protein